MLVVICIFSIMLCVILSKLSDIKANVYGIYNKTQMILEVVDKLDSLIYKLDYVGGDVESTKDMLWEHVVAPRLGITSNNWSDD